MPIKHVKKIMISLLIIVVVSGSMGLYSFCGNSVSQAAGHELPMGVVNNIDQNRQAVSLNSVQDGPMNVFPGQLVNESYYLGATSPSAAYYEVTVTLNSSSYETVDVFPTYSTSLSPAGYYLLFSFVMPNDQPGMWWNVAYELISENYLTVTSNANVVIDNTGQIWMSVWTASPGNNYMIVGSADFPSTYNASEISLYPTNPKYASIVSAQVNSWRLSNDILEVNFTLFESVESTNANTTPPYITASIIYITSLSYVTSSSPILISADLRVTLIQGNGAYLMGITSSQIAEITNSLNQTLSIPISQLNAAVISINGDVATLQTSFGTMTTKLSEINATITSIEGGQATIVTDIGILQTSLTSLSTTMTSISAGQVQITTDIGEITASLNSLNATFEGMNGTNAVIKTDVGSIATSLNSINATIYAIHQGMVDMNTSIGAVQVSLKSLNSSIIEVSGYTAEIMTYAGELNASLSDLNTSIFSSGSGIPWLNGTYADIETCLGNISGTITNVSNNTASISTSLGVVKASMSSIKSLTGQGVGADPPSLFEMIVIALLAGLLVISSLAMLSSRSTLKIMGDRVK
jgi:methyl-accepting chemotaxis protein